MTVKEIKRLQTHLDWFFRHEHIPHARVAVDGKLGPGTKKAIKDAKYYLGYLAANIAWSRGLGDKFIERLHHPTEVGPIAERLGRKRRVKARSFDTSTVQGCAKFLLNSPNARFIYVDDNGHTAREGVEQLARGEQAVVHATGGRTSVKLSLMQALVEMAKQGVIYINCLTNGNHTSGSHHYSGTAVDLDNTSPLGYKRIVAIAEGHGGSKNFEPSHYHLDF